MDVHDGNGNMSCVSLGSNIERKIKIEEDEEMDEQQKQKR